MRSNDEARFRRGQERRRRLLRTTTRTVTTNERVHCRRAEQLLLRRKIHDAPHAIPNGDVDDQERGETVVYTENR